MTTKQFILPLAGELVVDLFAGGGGWSSAFEMATGQHPHIAINHDADAISMHEANHPQSQHYQADIFEVCPREAVGDMPVGWMHLSPDCFPAGTLILTAKGYRPIEEIRIGDLVLTHRGRYRRVTATMSAAKQLLKVCGQGHPGLLVTAEHPFYARNAHNVWNNERRAYDRTLREPEWVKPNDLRTAGAPTNAAGGDLSFWATPCKFPELPIPAIGGRGMEITAALMWLAGRYLGDGWTRINDTRAELVITCSKSETEVLRQNLDQWKRAGNRASENELAWHERGTETAYQFTTSHRGLVEWLRAEFGHGAHKKFIPAWAFGMDAHLRWSLLAGYLSADGHTRTIAGSPVSEVQTASKALAFSARALVESLGMTAQVHGPFSNRTQIEGRSFNARPAWKIRWRESAQRLQNVRENLHNWTRLQSVSDAGQTAEVFNISVDEDESYIAEGVVTHNCTHHSQAKGGQPRDRKIRALSWVGIRWAGQVHPRIISLENVRQVLNWGPLVAKRCKDTGRVIRLDGSVAPKGEHTPVSEQFLIPCKKRAGETWKRFVSILRAMGYEVEWQRLVAADYGAPTTRDRLFLMARNDGQPIVWPEPTHFQKPARGQKKWRSAAECIDWSIPGRSIFNRPRPLADATMRRIARGVKRYVIDSGDPFIVPIANWSNDAVHSINEPLTTVTAWPRGGQHAVVSPVLVQTGYGEREGQAPRSLDMQRPLGTVVAGGAKHALATAYLAQMNGGFNTTPGHDVRRPASTITNTGSQQQLITAHLAHLRGNCDARDINDPLHTISAGGQHHGVVTAHMLAMGQNAIGHDMRDPAQTVLAGAPRYGLVECELSPDDEAGALQVAAFLIRYYSEGGQLGDLRKPMDTVTTRDRLALVTVHIRGTPYVIVDIKLRMLEPHELYAAQGFPPNYIITHGHDGRKFSKSAQVRMCGNSVSPPPAMALIQANWNSRDQIRKVA